MDEEILLAQLVAFFLDSLREDAGDVDNWCSQGAYSVDDLVDAIARHTSKSI